ncbi:MAG: thioesterase family protein [Alphaproteobacteria bacterium]|nr:thioesterase family protein [Alphaproteobacteria bacterium]
MQYEDRVRPEWIDNNDHMNLAYYVLVFEGAIGAMAERLGLAGGVRMTQMHTVYEREVMLGDRLRVETHLLAADATRLHLFQELFHAETGYRSATLETLAEHDAPFTAEAARSITALIAASPPEGAGRRIAMARRR